MRFWNIALSESEGVKIARFLFQQTLDIHVLRAEIVYAEFSVARYHSVLPESNSVQQNSRHRRIAESIRERDQERGRPLHRIVLRMEIILLHQVIIFQPAC